MDTFTLQAAATFIMYRKGTSMCKPEQKPRILPADAPPEQPPQPSGGDLRYSVAESKPLAVMLGATCVAVAKSGTYARRIANALNLYTPGRRGF